jgi:beta-lactamase superfamily II metal-dependent hydrolase
MAARNSAKKTAKKAARKSASKTTASRSKSHKSVATKHARLATKRARPARKTTAAKARRGRGKRAGKAQGMLRVRMYRIGFGDFFLLTVPTATGPEHILIDCGVHAGDIKSMDDCVKDLVRETGGKLALVIATHFHADHLSGFASNFDDFAQFEVGAVWLSNRLDPGNADAVKFHAQIASLANHLRLQFGARDDLDGLQARFKMENALGIQLDAREGSNAKALRLLTEGFKNKPVARYYQGGDEPELPDALKGAITAQLLGPAPKDSGGMFAGTDNKREQYLAAAADDGLPTTETFTPFEKDWPASASDYPVTAFREYITGTGSEDDKASSAAMEKRLKAAQPDVLLAMADAVDGTLNNQSLVILFTCQGKKLLFVGDAQWGNWSYWLYGKKVTGADPGITETAKEILGSIDFYKVGHHGSTNANPIPAMAAINENCVAMCSTETGFPDSKRPYGDPAKGTEVPRTKLMEALEKQTKQKLMRSDWIKVGATPASPEAKSELADLPDNFSTGDLYVDYIFPN